ncbi:hypothetical protein FB451DRAFT_1189914 [Mycena latifolia]|nr:hypothetical protein FB451DRAFT_1189914 [Mycena latifolia]
MAARSEPIQQLMDIRSHYRGIYGPEFPHLDRRETCERLLGAIIHTTKHRRRITLVSQIAVRRGTYLKLSAGPIEYGVTGGAIRAQPNHRNSREAWYEAPEIRVLRTDAPDISAGMHVSGRWDSQSSAYSERVSALRKRLWDVSQREMYLRAERHTRGGRSVFLEFHAASYSVDVGVVGVVGFRRDDLALASPGTVLKAQKCDIRRNNRRGTHSCVSIDSAAELSKVVSMALRVLGKRLRPPFERGVLSLELAALDSVKSPRGGDVPAQARVLGGVLGELVSQRRDLAHARLCLRAGELGVGLCEPGLLVDVCTERSEGSVVSLINAAAVLC